MWAFDFDFTARCDLIFFPCMELRLGNQIYCVAVTAKCSVNTALAFHLDGLLTPSRINAKANEVSDLTAPHVFWWWFCKLGHCYFETVIRQFLS